MSNIMTKSKRVCVVSQAISTITIKSISLWLGISRTLFISKPGVPKTISMTIAKGGGAISNHKLKLYGYFSLHKLTFIADLWISHFLVSFYCSYVSRLSKKLQSLRAHIYVSALKILINLFKNEPNVGHGYSTLGYGRGYGLGYSRYGYGKRSADAEPEADALYGAYGYGGYGLGHRTYSLGYGHGVGHGYSTLGYGHGYELGYSRYGYGKRSADAEPEADADALYGAYGYGGYGLGRRTYSLGHGIGYGRHSTFGRGYGYGGGFGYYG
jgi:hypothetical protein